MTKPRFKPTKAPEKKHTIEYAMLECCHCHESYYAHSKGRGGILIPNFIQESDVFPAYCPICNYGTFARVTTFIQYELNEEEFYGN